MLSISHVAQADSMLEVHKVRSAMNSTVTMFSSLIYHAQLW